MDREDVFTSTKRYSILRSGCGLLLLLLLLLLLCLGLFLGLGCFTLLLVIFLLAEQDLILLLSLEPRLLEQLSICIIKLVAKLQYIVHDTSLTFGVGKADGYGDSLRFTFAHIGGNIPEPSTITGRHGRNIHVRGNWMHNVSNTLWVDDLGQRVGIL
jgi:hypothetical protein